MASFTINSRKGPQEFTVSGDGGYVRLNGKQICERGHITGPALACNEANLEKTARKWWAAALKHERA